MFIKEMFRGKAAQIALTALCVVLMLLTIFLIVLSVMFSGGKSAVDSFGSNLYFVKSNSFDLIPAPSIVIGEKIQPASLGAGDIVIFESDDGGTLIGEINEVLTLTSTDDTDESDSTDENTPQKQGRHFKIDGESGESHIIAEDMVISKAVQTSRTLGVIVNFVTSPMGVLVIAVIPCVCILLWEVVRPIVRKITGKKEVPIINKQEEVPTFVPIGGAGDNPKTENIHKPTKSAAALKAYKETLNISQETTQPQLYVSPKPSENLLEKSLERSLEKPLEKPLEKSSEKPSGKPIPATNKKKPLSSVKLAEVIANVNREAPNSIEELPLTEKAKHINQALAKRANYKVPKEGN